MTSPRTFAFVFARGGSKGLPGKNILPIAGHPMLAHGIHLAHQIPEITSVFVSTDCLEIGNIAVSYGAELILRPPHLASDTAPEWLAWQHAVEYAQARRGHFDRFLSLPPTAPCRSIDDVKRCLNALTHDTDLVLTTTPSHRSPWFNMVTDSDDGYLRLVNSGNRVNRRQDAPACFDIATAAYAAHTSFIMEATGIWDGKIRGVEIPPERSIDIDTPLDYALARFLKEHYIPSLERFGDA
jgi:CMP-N-acetylneuraminic acid synthetase